MAETVVIKVEQLRALSRNLNLSMETIQGEATKTSGFVTELQDALQGVNPALAEHLTELKTLYGNIASTLQEHHQHVNSMISDVDAFINRFQSGG